jgi:hypothetical protein
MYPELFFRIDKESGTGPYPILYESSIFFFRVYLILSSLLCRVYPSTPLPTGFLTKVLYAFVLAPLRAACLYISELLD